MDTSQKKPIFFIIICMLVIAVLGELFWPTIDMTLAQITAGSYPEVSYISKHLSWKQGEVMAYFQTLATEKGATYAYHVLQVAPLPPNIEIHLVAHIISDVLYKTKGAEGIMECTQDFRNACSHAMVIGLYTDFGESALEKIDTVCRSAPGGSAAYTMCYHGLGHGILAYYGYDLEKTIAVCQKTGTKQYKDQEAIECIGGAIMELVGGGSHDRKLWQVQRKKYLSETDVLAPCNKKYMPDNARGMCYLHLTSHFAAPMKEEYVTFTRQDAIKAFQACNLIPKERTEDREYCFGGVSKEFILILKKRDIRKIPYFTSADLRAYIGYCQLAGANDGIAACIKHNVNTFYWGGAGSSSLVVRFCRLIPDENERKGCFSHFLQSVRFYSQDQNILHTACRLVPAPYRIGCTKR